MDKMYVYLKEKLDEMRKNQDTTIEVDFKTLAEMYQIVCFMKQIKEIMDWVK